MQINKSIPQYHTTVYGVSCHNGNLHLNSLQYNGQLNCFQAKFKLLNNCEVHEMAKESNLKVYRGGYIFINELH